ncbi:MAG TPA: hypothetical protein VFF24_02520, partial [Acidimicrobiia bacterium]|nr:hypothetical protein [Acidimicrobiia bacterium]
MLRIHIGRLAAAGALAGATALVGFAPAKADSPVSDPTVHNHALSAAAAPSASGTKAAAKDDKKK